LHAKEIKDSKKLQNAKIDSEKQKKKSVKINHSNIDVEYAIVK
jgi:hypothetical protein